MSNNAAIRPDLTLDQNGRPQPTPTARTPDVPDHAVEAYVTYLAELDELLAHVAAHPAERWVAYRGRQRLGFGTDDLVMWQELMNAHPDGRFTLYGIDGCEKYANDTVL